VGEFLLCALEGRGGRRVSTTYTRYEYDSHAKVLQASRQCTRVWGSVESTHLEAMAAPSWGWRPRQGSAGSDHTSGRERQSKLHQMSVCVCVCVCEREGQANMTANDGCCSGIAVCSGADMLLTI
jgi:hypothetical protein